MCDKSHLFLLVCASFLTYFRTGAKIYIRAKKQPVARLFLNFYLFSRFLSYKLGHFFTGRLYPKDFSRSSVERIGFVRTSSISPSVMFFLIGGTTQ